MATSTRQYGRRGVGNTNTTTSGSSTGAPPRRYVLDVPTGRTIRTGRVSRINDGYDGYDQTTIRSRSAGSRDYYYRDGGSESSGTGVNRYLEDASIKQLIESSANYTNTFGEDQEVQRITSEATPNVKDYPINVDANPELIVRPNTQRLTYTQDIAVRYLKPNTPPPPGPIIIREIRAPQPPPAPPIILRQRPPPPRTPSPVIIREKPPSRPKSVPTTIIKKVIPPPPPPPRKLIIERLPNLPPKPRPVIIERWLPYHKQKRQVIHEKAKPFEPQSRIKNTIIEWRPPEVEVVKHVKQLGVQDADPQRYYTQYGDKLYTTEFVQRKLTELGLQEELALMQEQQVSAAKEEIAFEQADDYNVRQILNSIPTFSRQIYTTSSGRTVSRLGRSSSGSRVIDEYGERQTIYDRSINNSDPALYAGDSYNFDQARSSILTEEMLLRSHSTNGGKFPTHLLTRLGSQVYDMPSEQVALTNSGIRTTSRYYTVNQDEAADEAGEPQFTEDKYVQIKASELKDVLANYDVYSSTGQKLEGEQITF